MRWPASTERLMLLMMRVSLPSSARYPQAITENASIGFGRFIGSRNSNWKSALVNTGPSRSMRASAFTRLCACLALLALALNRSMNFCRCAMRSCCLA